MKKLQVKQNDTMRIVLNKKRKDLTPRETLLKEYKTKSVNQIAAETTVMELWRAYHFRVDAIHGSYKTDKSTRRQGMLRTSKSPTSFISKSAMLWNEMSENFRNQKTLRRNAKKEAEKVMAKLPLI